MVGLSLWRLRSLSNVEIGAKFERKFAKLDQLARPRIRATAHGRTK